MPLTFVKTMTVRRLVTFNKPRDGEGFDQVKAHITFEILPLDEKNPPAFDQAFFRKVVKNIEDVQDEATKQPITFTPEFLADFVSVEYLHAGLTREYITLTKAAGRGN